jgi:hypothetical protein
MRQSAENHARRAVNVVATRALLVALAVAPMSVNAEEGPDLLTDPFRVSLGGFVLESDVTVRLDGDTGRGTPVDWDDTFGGGDSTRFRLEGHWRFGERHALRGLYFTNDWDRSRTAENEIEWQGEVYPVGARVKAEFSTDIYMLAYDYAFLKREDYEIYAGIGLHYTSVSAGLSARISGEGGEVDRSLKNEGSVDLPLPVIALGGLWRLPRNFWLSGSGQLFALEIDDYDGNLIDATLALTWQPKPWLGIGFAYNYFKVDVDVTKDRFNGNLDWVYDGPMIYYNASF